MSHAPESPKLVYLHGVLLVAAMVVYPFLTPEITWPGYLLVPLMVYLGLVISIPGLRRSFPTPQVGSLAWKPILTTLVLSVITVTVLLSYHKLAKPDVSELLAHVPPSWVRHLWLAGICFSLFNAILEEAIFRWVLFDAVLEEWGSVVALVTTSLCFGYGHLHGYPPGWVGAVLAGIFGLGLALLRWWTGGLLLGVVIHICADATIFYILSQELVLS